MISRQAFLAAVLACEGTPVVHMGRTVGLCLDCVGLPWAAARAAGLDMQATRRYFGLPSADELAAGLADFCDRCDPLAGHLLQVYVGKQARHVVVPIGDGVCMEAFGKYRKVQRVAWPDRIAAGWRIRGVA